ncbi:MAG: nitrilase-related carbon-nitrogen hydrolase [Spirochaetia bacterium]
MNNLRVGIAQINPALGDVEKNIEKHRHFLEEAKEKGVQLLLFPELSLTGYGLDFKTLDVAMRDDAPALYELARAAEGVHTVIGFVEEGPAAQFYNSSVVVSRGDILFVHRKINLATYGHLEEGKYFGSGRKVETFTIEAPWVGSILICADLWNPALVYLASLQGATLLLAPTNSALDAVSSEFSNLGGWEIAVRYYSMIYGMPLLMANRVGSEKGMDYWGGSQIVDPFGKTVVSAENESEQLIIADLDYDSVRKARHQLPTVRDSDLELVTREINRISDYSGFPPERDTL